MLRYEDVNLTSSPRLSGLASVAPPAMLNQAMKRICENCRCDVGPCGRRFCRRCTNWAAKAKALRAELRATPEEEEEGRRSSRPFLVKMRLRTTLKILEELKWRGTGRIMRAPEPERIRSLIYSLAAACRTRVDETALAKLDKASPRARKALNDILLSMIEDLPFRKPVLHLDRQWHFRAHFDGGWMDWGRGYWLLTHDERKEQDRRLRD